MRRLLLITALLTGCSRSELVEPTCQGATLDRVTGEPFFAHAHNEFIFEIDDGCDALVAKGGGDCVVHDGRNQPVPCSLSVQPGAATMAFDAEGPGTYHFLAHLASWTWQFEANVSTDERGQPFTELPFYCWGVQRTGDGGFICDTVDGEIMFLVGGQALPSPGRLLAAGQRVWFDAAAGPVPVEAFATAVRYLDGGIANVSDARPLDGGIVDLSMAPMGSDVVTLRPRSVLITRLESPDTVRTQDLSLEFSPSATFYAEPYLLVVGKPDDGGTVACSFFVDGGSAEPAPTHCAARQDELKGVGLGGLFFGSGHALELMKPENGVLHPVAGLRTLNSIVSPSGGTRWAVPYFRGPNQTWWPDEPPLRVPEDFSGTFALVDGELISQIYAYESGAGTRGADDTLVWVRTASRTSTLVFSRPP